MHKQNSHSIASVPMLTSIGFLLLLLTSIVVWAEMHYMSQEAFLGEQFTAQIPKPSTLWLVKDRAKQAKKILGHQPRDLRQRYWKQGNKTAWILEEIGKTELITAGFVVENGKISQIHVLTYRESRGGEVRYPSFLKQFFGATLKDDYFLDQSIDSISGATLSVRSMTRMARLALYYDQLSQQDNAKQP